MRPRRCSARDRPRCDGRARSEEIKSKAQEVPAHELKSLKRLLAQTRGFLESTCLQVEDCGTKFKASSYQRGHATRRNVPQSSASSRSCSSAQVDRFSGGFFEQVVLGFPTTLSTQLSAEQTSQAGPFTERTTHSTTISTARRKRARRSRRVHTF